MQLAGKAALISGAGGGICRAIAVALAEAGAAVACCDITPEASAETARLVTAAGGRALSQACDVASEAQTRAIADAAHGAFGRLDILVSGAAKATILKEVLEGPRDPKRLPIQLIQPVSRKLAWLIDAAAAGMCG